MLAGDGKTVYMVVYNHFENDSRVRKEAVTLAKAGYDVHIIAVWKPGLPAYQALGRVQVHRLNNTPFYIQMLGRKRFDRLKARLYAGGRAGNQKPGRPEYTLGNTGFHSRGGAADQGDVRPSSRRNLLQFVLSTTKKLLVTISFYQNVRAFFAQPEVAVDIFHAHDLNTLYICHKMAKKCGAKLVYDSHELFVFRNRPYQPPTWFLKLETWFEKHYIRRSDAVITVSHSIAGYLSRAYEIPRPVLVMNAPHQRKPKQGTGSGENQGLRQALNIGNRKKILLYSGGVTFGRGLDKVIQSLAGQADLFFVMMGPVNTAYKAGLAAIAQEAGVADQVAFFGPVPYEEVTAYTASADIGLAPIENICLSYYYCAPNKVFEYIQGGIPVVASDFPDLQRIVEKEQIGLTCSTQNPRAILATLRKVLEQYGFFADNVQKIRQKYCWEKESRVLRHIYQQLGR